MSIVIDASALVAFVTNEPASPAVAQLLDGWNSQDTSVNAPALARYEIANALTKKAAAGNLTDDETQEAWDVVEELPIVTTRCVTGQAWCRSRSPSSAAPPTTLRTSTLPATWAPSCGPSTVRSPATPAPTATQSI